MTKNIENITTFATVEDAVKTLKLDRRHKQFEWNGYLVYSLKYCAPNSCIGCNGGGCHECGGCGKRTTYTPIHATLLDGSLIKISNKSVYLLC